MAKVHKRVGLTDSEYWAAVREQAANVVLFREREGTAKQLKERAQSVLREHLAGWMSEYGEKTVFELGDYEIQQVVTIGRKQISADKLREFGVADDVIAAATIQSPDISYVKVSSKNSDEWI